MSTTKVLHVIARMNIGGTARYVGDLVENIEGSVLATGYVQGLEIEDSIVSDLNIYRVHHLGRRISPVNDLIAYRELRRIIRELKPEIVHTHTFKAGLLGRLIPGRHKRIHTFHGHLFEDASFSRKEKFLITFLEKFLARRTDVLISVGEKVGLDLKAAGIGRNKKWLSIPPGVTPLKKFDRPTARGVMELDPEPLVVGWMARVTSVKNPRLLVEVAKNMPNTQFVMAGGGELLEEIQSIAPQNIKIIGWSDPSFFWSAVDIALSTSDNEGMPIALIEAQMAGVPVVATDVGSNSEILVDGVTGIIVEKSARALELALVSIISKQLAIMPILPVGIKTITERFSKRLMVQNHLEAYSALGEK